MYRARGPLTQGPPVAPNQIAGSAGAGPCLPPWAQPPPPQAPVHRSLKYVNRPRGAPAALRPPGSPLRCSLFLGPRGSKTTSQPKPPQDTPVLSRHQHRPRGPGVSLREGAGVSSPSGLHSVWGDRHAPSDTLLDPHWGRYAIAEAWAAEQGRNTSAHTAMPATPP
ncbi:hypothetical protein NDU88_001161 [Pleurodeles waltl]|uniref:Uncharacterized protein n=1 Tax=Pleurodeles waltl TaxID=8319 RepID=A0AAV7W0N2_PLEWA|nr:hypothetical protein NDU88_001161 [Pleurodeles waltl]